MTTTTIGRKSKHGTRSGKKATSARKAKATTPEKKPEPQIRARVFYDHPTRQIILSNPETKVEFDRRGSVQLTNVQVLIEAGTRAGCLNTGFLGFLVGDVSETVGEPGEATVVWCGEDFQSSGGKRMDTARRVVIVNGSMTADL